MKDYEKQAKDFLVSTGVDIKTVFKKNDYHFKGDTDKRDIYSVTISRGSRSFTFDFGQSLSKSGFYAIYGKTKYFLPYDLLEKSDSELKQFIKYNFQYDFGNVKTNKINKPIKPSNYNILACLTKYDPNTFEDFCSEFGYSTDSISAMEIYKAVKEEWKNVQTIWTDKEIDLLIEIQ